MDCSRASVAKNNRSPEDVRAMAVPTNTPSISMTSDFRMAWTFDAATG